MKIYPNPIPDHQAWPRNYLLRILDAGLLTEEYNFVRQTALTWLSSFPGDLPVRRYQSEAMISSGLTRQALPILQHLARVDPEDIEARYLLQKAYEKMGLQDDEINQNCILAIEGIQDIDVVEQDSETSWGHTLATIRHKLIHEDIDTAHQKIQQLLGLASHAPLSGITHLKILKAQKNTPWQSIRKLAEHYHKQWPDCLQFSLILAEILMNSSNSVQAVNLLHTAASKDVSGQVATRLWGKDHPYQSLWPESINAYINSQIPSSIAVKLGWNLLPLPQGKTDEEIRPELKDNESQNKPTKQEVFGLNQTGQGDEKETGRISLVRNIFSRKNLKPEELTTIDSEAIADRQRKKSNNADGLFPVYVIFTTKKGLQKKYGIETTAIIDEAMRDLIKALRTRLDWGSILVYADDPNSMAQYGLKPAPEDDPWKLKLSILDIDDSLAQRGARIGSILIVGDSQVVPFHNLPNPTDDSDAQVPSDNPYGTRDENYFIPEWPVGRLPGGSGRDPGLLLSTLRAMTEYHTTLSEQPAISILAFILWLIQLIFKKEKSSGKNFGYSAEVWKEISSSIFKTIGNPRTMITSPPNEPDRSKMLPNSKLGYFNLHGIADSAEWFGQRDPKKSNDGPEYPIALHPKDIVNGGRAPKVVFSEACYGANIQNKSVDEAIALKFLASGCQAVIGSTVVSYGSVNPPLNAADLLGKAFWENFKEGMTVGEALRRAKITLTSEMHERQGYLDGEDQKTLISFVLYGDPLYQEKFDGKLKHQKIYKRADTLPEMKTVCDRVETPGTSDPISREMVGKIKAIVEQYLPGMRDAHISLSHEHTECCCDGHVCPTSQLGIKYKINNDPKRQVVTLSKQTVRSKYVHKTFAKVTLDNEGNMVKLAVSR